MLVEPGDLMALWITGTRNPGIYQIGVITGRAQERPGIDDVYLVDPSRASKPTRAVPYESVVLRHHFPRADLKQHPDLTCCEQFTSPQITNPSFLTPRSATR